MRDNDALIRRLHKRINSKVIHRMKHRPHILLGEHLHLTSWDELVVEYYGSIKHEIAKPTPGGFLIFKKALVVREQAPVRIPAGLRRTDQRRLLVAKGGASVVRLHVRQGNPRSRVGGNAVAAITLPDKARGGVILDRNASIRTTRR